MRNQRKFKKKMNPLLPKVVNLFTSNLKRRAPYPVPSGRILFNHLKISSNNKPIKVGISKRYRPLNHAATRLRTPNSRRIYSKVRTFLPNAGYYPINNKTTFKPFSGWDLGHRKTQVYKDDADSKEDKRNMNWEEAKRRFPKLRPFSDADKDGVVNMWDCKPFNKNKQGYAHEDVNQMLADYENNRKKELTVDDFRTSDDDEYAVDKYAGYNAAESARKEAEMDVEKNEDKEEQADWDDQISYDPKKASKNITKITKEYKDKPFPKKK